MTNDDLIDDNLDLEQGWVTYSAAPASIWSPDRAPPDRCSAASTTAAADAGWFS